MTVRPAYRRQVLRWQDRYDRIEATAPLSGADALELLAGLGYADPSPVVVTPLGGGFRRHVYRVDFEAASSLTLRFDSRDAAAVESEVAVMRQARASGVPVPRVLHVAPVSGRRGSAVVLEFVPGALLDDVDVNDRRSRALYGSAGATLAMIHAIRFPAAGFLGTDAKVVRPFGADFGLSRMLTGQARDELVRERLGDPLCAEVEHLAGRLAPERDATPCLVHGDFNPKNLVTGPDAVIAVLDWEFALAGDPLMDVGNFLRFDAELPGGLVDAFADGYRSASGELHDTWRRDALAVDLTAQLSFLARADAGPRTVATAINVVKHTMRQLSG